jgi:hypothetical protein
MNVLDENIVGQQCKKLREWRIPFRQVGPHLSATGALDENLIPLLHQLSQPTFFTHDRDFFKASLCHSHYAIAFLDVSDTEEAEFIRRFLKHQDFDTNSKRLGTVVCVQARGLRFWKKGSAVQRFVAWSD